MTARKPAPWRIGKTYEGHWAVWTVETLSIGEVRTVVQRFSSFGDACAAYREGGWLAGPAAHGTGGK